MSLWGAGANMLLYLAGLQGIPTHLYEAARIDGANAVAAVLERHAADALADDLLQPDAEHHRLLPGVHAGLPADERRAEQRHAHDGAVSIPQVVPAVPVRLRLGDRLGAVRDHPGVHAAGHPQLGRMGILRGERADDVAQQPRRAATSASRSAITSAAHSSTSY